MDTSLLSSSSGEADDGASMAVQNVYSQKCYFVLAHF